MLGLLWFQHCHWYATDFPNWTLTASLSTIEFEMANKILQLSLVVSGTRLFLRVWALLSWPNRRKRDRVVFMNFPTVFFPAAKLKHSNLVRFGSGIKQPASCQFCPFLIWQDNKPVCLWFELFDLRISKPRRFCANQIGDCVSVDQLKMFVVRNIEMLKTGVIYCDSPVPADTGFGLNG